jgi:hypothetical protein
LVVKAERSARRNKLSKISIQGAATGTGVFTLESPATNTDRVLVLPDEAGTVLTTAGVPASAMPSGIALQVKHAVWATETTLTTTGVLDLFSTAITVQNGSRCVLMSSVNKYAGNGGSWPNVWASIFKQNGVELSTSETEHVGTNTGGANANTFTNLFVTDVLTAGSYTFMVSGRMIYGGSHQFNRYPRISTLVIIEVAA